MRHFVFHCLKHASHLIGLSKNHKKVGAVWQKKKKIGRRTKSYGVYGEFPTKIFKLPNLQILCARYNQKLTGYLPEFNSSRPFHFLKLANTGFFGKLPDSIGNLIKVFI